MTLMVMIRVLTKVTQSWDMTTRIPLPTHTHQRFSGGVIVAELFKAGRHQRSMKITFLTTNMINKVDSTNRCEASKEVMSLNYV